VHGPRLPGCSGDGRGGNVRHVPAQAGAGAVVWLTARRGARALRRSVMAGSVPSSSRKDPPMTARHSPLTAAEVIAKGGWHPRYARVIALASDDGYGFALADGNGDGSELEAEAWTWRDGAWQGSATSGGPARRHRADQHWPPDRRKCLVRLRQRPQPGHCHDRVRRQTPPSTRRVARCVGVYRRPPKPSRPGRPRPRGLTRAPDMRGSLSTRPGCPIRADRRVCASAATSADHISDRPCRAETWPNLSCWFSVAV
jgi:hypothetical protein